MNPTAIAKLQKRIDNYNPVRVAVVGPSATIYEDPIYGDEAPLILVVNGKVVAADFYDIKDYMDNLETYL
jgi:hypothetical protein